MSMFPYIISILVAISNASPEQIAFNYFASEIMEKNYSDSKAIYFSGQTEGEKNIAWPFANCFESDTNFKQFYNGHRKTGSAKLNIQSASFSRLHKSSKIKSKQLNLKIYRAVANGETVYVYMNVFKDKHFADHYLVKIFSTNVVDVCHVNELM